MKNKEKKRSTVHEGNSRSKRRVDVTGSMYVVADFLVLLAVVCIARPFFDVNFEYYNGITPLSFTLIYTFLFVIVGFNFDMYKIRNKKNFDVIFSTTAASIITSVFIETVGMIMFSGPGARTLIALLVTMWISMCVFRLLLNKITHIIRGVQTLLVIESSDADDVFAKKIKYSCLDWFDSWYVRIDTNDSEKVEQFLKGEFKKYNNVFITQSVPSDVKKRIINEAITDDKEIYFIPSMYDINITKYDMIQFADTPSFRVKHIGLNAGQRFLKRSFDIMVSLIGLIVLSPVIVAVSIAVKASDGGPVLYSQERITRGGKPFNIYKFRTMVVNAEKLSGPVLASDNDPRITKIGRFLRATRLDEIPQLINILAGDMSIVGPRPERPKFVNEFIKTIPDYDKRHIVKAGLTGYAQVYSKYNTDVQDKLLYDLLYIREYSFLLDIKLMILTIKTILTKDATEGVKNK